MCLVKIHGEEMPGDVESVGAEGGVADMDEIEEIWQLTQLLDVEALMRRVIGTRILKKTCYPYAFMEKRLLYHVSLFIVKL